MGRKNEGRRNPVATDSPTRGLRNSEDSAFEELVASRVNASYIFPHRTDLNPEAAVDLLFT